MKKKQRKLFNAQFSISNAQLTQDADVLGYLVFFLALADGSI